MRNTEQKEKVHRAALRRLYQRIFLHVGGKEEGRWRNTRGRKTSGRGEKVDEKKKKRRTGGKSGGRRNRETRGG